MAPNCEVNDAEIGLITKLPQSMYDKKIVQQFIWLMWFLINVFMASNFVGCCASQLVGCSVAPFLQ